MSTDLPARLYARTERRPNGCWAWTGSKNRKGYGQVSVAGRLQRTHRVSWSVSHGEIPEGTLVLHHCGNASCVNPDHLYLETLARSLDDYTIPEPNSGCLLWLGSVDRGGYGKVWVKDGPGRGTYRKVHRVAWEAANGPIPAGLQIDHKCRVRSCVNTAHLEAVTHAENILRGLSFSAQNKRKAHCLRGHPFAGDGIHVDPKGRRVCMACVRARWHAREQRRRANG